MSDDDKSKLYDLLEEADIHEVLNYYGTDKVMDAIGNDEMLDYLEEGGYIDYDEFFERHYDRSDLSRFCDFRDLIIMMYRKCYSRRHPLKEDLKQAANDCIDFYF